jgi:V/A-type H+-transporting ATPase subunit E
MPELEKADVRIQEICDKIRNETLDPAKDEANAIIEKARATADAIIKQAQEKANDELAMLQERLNEEKQIFRSSLEQACKQTLEQLKLKIEERFFNPALADWIQKSMGDEKASVKLVEVLIEAIHKEGIRSELAVVVPKQFNKDQINAQLSEAILKQLRNHSVELADIASGVLVKVENKHMVLDLSSKALEDLVASFIRKDFRAIFFNT